MADRQAGSLWTPEEDVLLLRHVSKYGTKHWGYLQSSGVLPHRDQKACCNRFILLKRKFFQARARGQRLSFPVMPPSEPQGPGPCPGPHDARAANTTGGPPTAGSSIGLGTSPRPSASCGPSSLAANHSVSFKRHSKGGAPHAHGDPWAQEVPSPEQRTGRMALEVRTPRPTPTGSPGPPLSGLERAMSCSAESFPEKPCNSPAPCSSGIREQLGSLEVHVKKGKGTVASTFALTSAERVASCSSIIPDLVERPTASHGPKVPVERLHSWANLTLPPPGCWRGYDSALDAISAGLPADHTAVDVPEVVLPGNSQEAVAPDTLLDQIATAPAKMLFGGNPVAGAGEGLLDVYSCAEGAAWQGSPPASCVDLWGFMASSASV